MSVTGERILKSNLSKRIAKHPLLELGDINKIDELITQGKYPTFQAVFEKSVKELLDREYKLVKHVK